MVAPLQVGAPFARPAARRIHRIQPLADPRWDNLVQASPDASVFHTRPWLEALHRTYGYRPIVFTTSPPDAPLKNGLVFCRIDSWLTGSRLVSLPFSDHCVPLVNSSEDLQQLFAALESELAGEKLDYLEFRPKIVLRAQTSLLHWDYSYCFHELDLRPGLGTLFSGFHKDSTQRKIRRAEREGLTYEEGRSDALLDDFYGLLLLTRRRHRIPPQPKTWFRNLADCLGESLKIRVAYKGGRPAAAILTLRHKDVLVYKNGASDTRFHPLGVMQFLLWRSIQEAKLEGMRAFDLGRSNILNPGLIAFKDRWGSARSTLTYSRYSAAGAARFTREGAWKEQIAKLAVSCLPARLFRAVGEVLYRHIG